MAAYVCSKCGAEADSKCAAHRTVFLDEPPLFQKTTIERQEYPGYHSSVVSLTIVEEMTVNENVDNEEAIASILRSIERCLREATVGRIMQEACDHDWRLESPQCELGCCKKEE